MTNATDLALHELDTFIGAWIGPAAQPMRRGEWTPRRRVMRANHYLTGERLIGMDIDNTTVNLLMEAAQCVLDPEGFDVNALSSQLQIRAGVLMGLDMSDAD